MGPTFGTTEHRSGAAAHLKSSVEKDSLPPVGWPKISVSPR